MHKVSVACFLLGSRATEALRISDPNCPTLFAHSVCNRKILVRMNHGLSEDSPTLKVAVLNIPQQILPPFCASRLWPVNHVVAKLLGDSMLFTTVVDKQHPILRAHFCRIVSNPARPASPLPRVGFTARPARIATILGTFAI